MKLLQYLTAFLAVSAFIVLVGYFSIGLWHLGAYILEGAKELKPETYVPLAVTITSAAIGLFAALVTQSRVRKREIEAAHRERKIEIYLDFLETMEAAFMSVKPELGFAPLDQNDLAKKLIQVRTKAVLWGSTGVLRSLSDMAKMDGATQSHMFTVMDNIQREMRKDIGLSNAGLEKHFFTKLILNNADELEQLTK